MRVDHRGTPWLAAMGAALIAGCGPTQRSIDDVPSGPLLMGRECAGYNGNGQLSGSLHGKRDLARRIAMRLRALDSLGRIHVGAAGDTVRLIPICENHKLSDNQLQRGRFVGVLTGPGTAPEYSTMPNDTVFWWIYGERMREPGRDTIVWHSEYLSMRSDAGTPYTKAAHLRICEGERPRREEERSEEVEWHADSCHVDSGGGIALLSGDRPWFGCTRGCCYAARTL